MNDKVIFRILDRIAVSMDTVAKAMISIDDRFKIIIGMDQANTMQDPDISRCDEFDPDELNLLVNGLQVLNVGVTDQLNLMSPSRMAGTLSADDMELFETMVKRNADLCVLTNEIAIVIQKKAGL